MLKSAKNLFLALVGGKIGSNEKTQKVKCFSIISRNINPDALPEIPKITFYHPLLSMVTVSFAKMHLASVLMSWTH